MANTMLGSVSGKQGNKYMVPKGIELSSSQDMLYSSERIWP